MTESEFLAAFAEDLQIISFSVALWSVAYFFGRIFKD